MKTTGFMNGKNIKKIALAAVVVLLSVAPLNAQVEWTTIDEMGSIDLTLPSLNRWTVPPLCSPTRKPWWMNS